MKTAFVLSGGGAAGAYQFGAMKAVIKDFGITPDFIAANSAGALNAAGLSFTSLEETEQLWRSIKGRGDVFTFKPLSPLTIFLGGKSFFSNDPLRKLLTEKLSGKAVKIPFTVNYCDLRTEQLKRELITDSSDESIAKIVASTSIPFVVTPDKGYRADGGIVENTPLKPAIDWGAERIFVFLCKPKESKIIDRGNPKNAIDIAVRTARMAYTEAIYNDMKVCLRYNSVPGRRVIDLHFFAPPDERAPEMFDFSPEAIGRSLSEGYLDALSKGLTKSNIFDGKVIAV